jgi:hypothetical protein
MQLQKIGRPGKRHLIRTRRSKEYSPDGKKAKTLSNRIWLQRASCKLSTSTDNDAMTFKVR